MEAAEVEAMMSLEVVEEEREYLVEEEEERERKKGEFLLEVK